MLSSTRLRTSRKAEERLDRVFGALSDSTRRAMLARLTRGPAGVTELAQPFAISLQAVSKHLKVLERAGLVAREIDGREHRCSLRAGALETAAQWIAHRRVFWERTLDALEDHLTQRRNAAQR